MKERRQESGRIVTLISLCIAAALCAQWPPQNPREPVLALNGSQALPESPQEVAAPESEPSAAPEEAEKSEETAETSGQQPGGEEEKAVPVTLRPSGPVTLSGFVAFVRGDGKTAVLQANSEDFAGMIDRMTDDRVAYWQQVPKEEKNVNQLELSFDGTDLTQYEGWHITVSGEACAAESPERLCSILLKVSSIEEAADSRVTETKTLYEGGVPLTLKLVERGGGESWGTLNRIDVYMGTEILQTLMEPSWCYTIDAWAECCVDLNFDGYMDLQFLERLPGTMGPSYNCYLWNPDKNRFELCAPLGDLNNLSAEPETQTLHSMARWGPGYYVFKDLRWREGVPEVISIYASILNYPLFEDIWQYYAYEKEDGAFIESRTYQWREPKEATDGQERLWLDEGPASPYTLPRLEHPQMDQLKKLAEYRDLYQETQALPEEERLQSDFYAWLLKTAYDHNEAFLQNGGGVSAIDLAELRESFRLPVGGTVEPASSGLFARCDDMEQVGRWFFGRDFILARPTPYSDVFAVNGNYHYFTNIIDIGQIHKWPVQDYRIFTAVNETAEGVVLEALTCDVIGDRVLTDDSHFQQGRGIGYIAEDGTPWFYNDFDLADLPRRRYTFYRASDGHYIATAAEPVSETLVPEPSSVTEN